MIVSMLSSAKLAIDLTLDSGCFCCLELHHIEQQIFVLASHSHYCKLLHNGHKESPWELMSVDGRQVDDCPQYVPAGAQMKAECFEFDFLFHASISHW
jgi:hypothetical protein